MAVPQRRQSSSRRDKRRAHDAIAKPTVISCPNCGESTRLHRVCASCGYYKGRAAVPVEEEEY